MAETIPPLRPVSRLLADAAGAPTRPAARPSGPPRATGMDVGRVATRFDALPLDRPALIGLFYTPEGASAVIRLPGGALVRAIAGTLVGDGRVVAVLRDGVRLQQGDDEVVLTLPS